MEKEQFFAEILNILTILYFPKEHYLGEYSHFITYFPYLKTITFVFLVLIVRFRDVICSGTMTTQAESINLDLQRGLGRRLRYTQH